MLADRAEKLYLCFTVMRSQKVCCGKKSSFPLRYTSKSIFNTILPIFKKHKCKALLFVLEPSYLIFLVTLFFCFFKVKSLVSVFQHD